MLRQVQCVRQSSAEVSRLMAVVATSGIVFCISEKSLEDKDVELRVSNCAGGDLNENYRAIFETPFKGKCEDLADFLKKSIGGDWTEEKRRVGDVIEEREVYSLKLSDFISSHRGEKFLLDLQRDLMTRDPSTISCATVKYYSLRPMLTGSRAFETVRCFFGGHADKARLWIKHLRAAGLSEYQIALHEEELLLEASRRYNPSGHVSLQEAIKQAVRYLDENDNVKEVRREYAKKPWKLVGAEELKKEDVMSDEDYERQLTPISVFKDAMAQRAKRLEAIAEKASIHLGIY